MINPKKYRFDIKRMMADCEANYARLCQLLRGEELTESALVAYSIDGCDESYRSVVDPVCVGAEQVDQGVTNFTLTVTEQHRFSTSVQVDIDQHGMEVDAGLMGQIQFTVMIYHDVRMAEVISCNQRHARLASYPVLNDVMFLPDEKAQQNRFLGEWLSLCLKQGLSAPVSLDFVNEELTTHEPQHESEVAGL